MLESAIQDFVERYPLCPQAGRGMQDLCRLAVTRYSILMTAPLMTSEPTTDPVHQTPPNPASDTDREMIGGYEYLGAIGRGGMVEVHRCHPHRFPGDVSPYGARGLAGYVRDRCLDPSIKSELWRPLAGGVHTSLSGLDAASDVGRVARGGGCGVGPDIARSAFRGRMHGADRNGDRGFRIVREYPTSEAG